MTTILEAEGIDKFYRSANRLVPVLRGIDLHIKKGEFVGIMGPSGAGKTTLLNVLATIDQPTSGALAINGMNVRHLKDEQLSEFRRQYLGFIFQDYNLLDSLTLKENLLLPLALANISVQTIEDRVEQIAKRLGIYSHLQSYPSEASGGQKQRTAIARAIIGKPAIVFADEPTGALDSKASTDLLQTFDMINKELATTFLMVTHDAFAASYCHRVLFIKDGSLYTQVVRGSKQRRAFYEQLLVTVTTIGGMQT